MDAMNAISPNHSDFAARVKRIERATAEAKQLLYVGMDEVYVMPRRERKAKVGGARALLQNAMYPVSMVLAVGLGYVAHSIGQILRYYIQGMPDPKANQDVEMVVQVILGLTIAICIGNLIKLRSSTHTLLMTLGAVLGLLMMHNAVHAYPEAFKLMTSALWVNEIVSHTSPHSIMWRGISFVF
jgi:hypothetical protein